MPKTNSESDFGGSLTSDAEDDIDAGPSSPAIASPQAKQRPHSIVTHFLNGNANQKHQSSPSPKNAQESSNRANFRSPRSIESRRPISFHSHHDRLDDPSKRPRLRGAALFRAAAHKIIRMHKTSALWGTLTGGAKAGAEPGVDPRHNSAHIAFGHVQQPCSINVVEYNSVRSKFRSFTNHSFSHFLDTQGTQKEPWAKARWIHIAGISWDVISKLALAYDLHPLSLEDVLQDQHKLARSKADYFQKHLFIRVLCHQVKNFEDTHDHESNITDVPRTSSPLPLSRSSFFRRTDSSAGNSILKMTSTRRKSSFHEEELEQGVEPPPYDEVETRANTAEEAILAIQQLKEGLRVNVVRRNLYMFLFRDGTLITIYQTNIPTFATPIMDRLRSTSTVLRSNSDASILVESILDLVVDQAMEVVEEYHKMLLKLESDILLKPKVRSVRHLHILSGDLALHKRTLEPLRSLIYGLRRYDYDRCLALETSSTYVSGEAETPPKVVGYMSHKSKIYLADVNDHMEYILSSLEMFGGISENLINYTFNMASYEMNEVMRRLTLATIIFLPLTLLTGYFGMNFHVMPSVQNHSDMLFWEIAIPVMAVVVPLFMWSDLIRVKHYVDKKWDIRYYRGVHRT